MIKLSGDKYTELEVTIYLAKQHKVRHSANVSLQQQLVTSPAEQKNPVWPQELMEM